MPPPRSRSAELRDNVHLFGTYLAERLLGPERDLPNHAARVGFFLIKTLTVMRPCWPYMSRMEISVPLLVAAALDLRVPDPASAAVARRTLGDAIEFGPARLRGLGWSVMFLLVHLLVIWGLGKWDALCVAPTRDVWDGW